MEERKRPNGISILSVLHILAVVIGAIIVTITMMRGQTPAWIVVAFLFTFALALASGIGMWKGRKWGWYLGTFYYLYEIVRNVNVLISIPTLISSLTPEELANMSRGPEHY